MAVGRFLFTELIFLFEINNNSMNEQAMSFTTEENGIFHCQNGYKYAPLKEQSN